MMDGAVGNRAGQPATTKKRSRNKMIEILRTFERHDYKAATAQFLREELEREIAQESARLEGNASCP